MFHSISFVVIVCIAGQISGQMEPLPDHYFPTIETHHPYYPAIALTAKAEGEVKVEVRIDPSGVVKQVRMISGHPLLQKVTETAVAQWRFVAEPETSKERKTIITYNFQITEEEIEEDTEVGCGDTPASFVVKSKSQILVTPGWWCLGNAKPERMEGMYWEDQKLKNSKKTK